MLSLRANAQCSHCPKSISLAPGARRRLLKKLQIENIHDPNTYTTLTCTNHKVIITRRSQFFWDRSPWYRTPWVPRGHTVFQLQYA